MILERIARETGVDEISIEAIINSADRLYKTYNIRKRTGGVRQINHPTPTLKFLQRWVVRNFIAHLPIHPSVTSYRNGIGISRNAQMHVAQSYLMKMDFRDFFPSITRIDVQNLIVENVENPKLAGLDGKDIEFITKIVCRNDRLTIGAFSSPSISNAVLFRFDEFMSNESTKRNVLYSRYADDIFFSTNTPNILVDIRQIVTHALPAQTSPRLNINDEKTVFTSKKRRRLVTGLVLTSANKLSIGRDKKRELKTLCHQFRIGNLSPEKASYLKGYLSYVRSVEPAFIESLRRKFGGEIMQRIIEAALIRRK
jgi:RNA-directed DNA polymerase